MRTLQEKYNAVLEGNFSKTQFRRDAAIEVPQFVSTVNSFDDTVAILKNKGAITEAKAQEPKYSTASPEDTVAPDVLDTGIKFELDKKYGTLDVTPEQYAKCREMAIKNLAKDVLYYVKQDSVQLEAPGEKMEKVSLKEGFLDRFKKKPAQSEPAPAKVLSADEIQAMIDQEAKTNTVGDILNAATVLGTIDLRNATPEQVKMFISIARDSDYGHDTITGDTYIDYLESLPNYKGVEEVKVKVAIPGQDEFEAEEGKDYEEEEADKYIANAKKSGATPMNTTFKKVNEEEVEEVIQNIENDEYTVKRIAKLTNQLLQDADPRDEVAKAYAISVKNDLESGDASRLKRYKDLLSLDDLKDDMEDYIGRDKDQLDEGEVVDLPMTAAGYSRGETYDTEKYGKVKIIDQLDGDDIPAAYGRFRVEKINEEYKDKPSLEKRKALKEMFKKIIVNLINE